MDLIKINNQPPEKLVKESKETLDVAEIFYTIQGEGPFVGRPAIFLRLAGCNLQCPACDTDYTSTRKVMNATEVAERIIELWPETANCKPLLVLTGGEPFRQQLGPFVLAAIFALGMDVQIETNGSFFQEHFPYEKVTIVCSPKTGSVNKKLQEHITAYKYVIDPTDVDPADGLPLHALGHPNKGHVAKPHPGFTGDVYLQPIDVGDAFKEKIFRLEVARLCMKHGYRLCLQTHKIVGLA